MKTKGLFFWVGMDPAYELREMNERCADDTKDALYLAWEEALAWLGGAVGIDVFGFRTVYQSQHMQDRETKTVIAAADVPSFEAVLCEAALEMCRRAGGTWRWSESTEAVERIRKVTPNEGK